MPIVLDGTAGITTPEIVSTGGPLVVNASAPDNSVVVNANGNVGIGTSSPGNPLTVAGVGGTASMGVFSATGTNNDAGINLLPNGTGNGVLRSGINDLVFAPNSTERMRISTAGSVGIGTNAPGGSRLNVHNTTEVGAFQFTGSNGVVRFRQAAGASIGSIDWSGSSTAYNTSSDYRLKHDIAPMTGALAKVAALKPCTYKWNADNSADEGFIAHELQEVCLSAVTGEKDAVDAEGNPQYQGIDTSFLVATLTAAIQELKAINDAQAQTIESLTARVVALEQA